MDARLNQENNLIISYITLREAIGILGLTFPFILYIGALIFFQTGIQSSISRYYHTGMGDVFVGTLCAIGFFLLSYKGYERDYIAGIFAGIFAVGTALFPTPLEGDVLSVHVVFAALFFLTLAYFSLFLFTKTHPNLQPTLRKKIRNAIYRFCGIVMLVCLVLIAVVPVLPDSIQAYNPIFWLEAATIVLFGISWLVKGEAILQDVA